MKTSAPLFVDLDHTLVKVDCLFESVGLLLKKNPIKIFKLMVLVLQGDKTKLKHWLDQQVTIDVESLPYNKEVLDLIKQKKATGSQVFLATATNQNVANAVAHHLGCFDGVMASDQKVNLKGKNKLNAINKMVKEIGADNFEYAGDNKADMPIFAESKRCYLVAKSKPFANKACKEFKQLEVIKEDWNQVKPYLKQLRPHQWSKNLLLLVPLIMTRYIGDL